MNGVLRTVCAVVMAALFAPSAYAWELMPQGYAACTGVNINPDQFSAGVQKMLPWATSMDVSYVGLRSWNDQQPWNINSIDLGTAFHASTQDPTLTPSATAGGRTPSTGGSRKSTRLPNWLRPRVGDQPSGLRSRSTPTPTRSRFTRPTKPSAAARRTA